MTMKHYHVYRCENGMAVALAYEGNDEESRKFVLSRRGDGYFYIRIQCG